MKNKDRINKTTKSLYIFAKEFDEQKINDKFCEEICPKRSNNSCPVITCDDKCPFTPEENCIAYLEAEEIINLS